MARSSATCLRVTSIASFHRLIMDTPMPA